MCRIRAALELGASTDVYPGNGKQFTGGGDNKERRGRNFLNFDMQRNATRSFSAPASRPRKKSTIPGRNKGLVKAENGDPERRDKLKKDNYRRLNIADHGFPSTSMCVCVRCIHDVSAS